MFVVKNGVLLAPPKNNLILPGITYDVVLEIAQAREFQLEVRAVTEAEVRSADEIWVTSSTKEVLAVTTLDGKPVGDGKPGPAVPAHARAVSGVQAGPHEQRAA